MESLRRVLVGLGGLISAAFAVLTALCLIDHTFGEQAMDYLDRCLVYNLQQIFVEGRHLWQPIVAFAVFLVVAVLLLIVACYRSKKPRLVKVGTADGSEIEISLSAIENVVRRAAASVPQVQNLTSNIKVSGDNLDIDLNVTVPADESLPAVGQAVRQAVSEQVAAMTGLTPRSVRVQVGKVADKTVARAADKAADKTAPQEA